MPASFAPVTIHKDLGLDTAEEQIKFQEDQFSSITQLCPTLCDLMDYGTSGFPVHHQPPEIAQTHVYWVNDAIQPSHPSSVVPFSSGPQSLPASESFPMKHLSYAYWMPPQLAEEGKYDRFSHLFCLHDKNHSNSFNILN